MADNPPSNTISTGTSTHSFPPLSDVKVYPKHTKRIAQTVRLKASSIDEYKKCHAAVWPDVLRQIHECGIRDYAIHLLPTKSGDLYLFAAFKYIGTDWAESCRLMAANPKVREWWEMTDGMQESDVSGAVGSAEGPGWWMGVEEVFYTDGES